MNPQQMRAQVREELSHIPDWPGEHQAELRMNYNARRMASLGRNAVGSPTRADVLRECLADVWNRHPGAVCNYDRDYFDC